MSIAALQDKNKILREIQPDAIMRQRWGRYCKENYYANSIPFDDVIEIVIGIVYQFIHILQIKMPLMC
jgi:hypothetical protein